MHPERLLSNYPFRRSKKETLHPPPATYQLRLAPSLRLLLLPENTLIIHKWEEEEQSRIIRWQIEWELNVHFVNSFFYSLLLLSGS